MRAGRLDRKIDLLRKTVTQSASGAEVEAWAPMAERLAASYRPVRGDERNEAPQFVAAEQVEFKIRWKAALADLNPKDRLVYPAVVQDVSPEDEPGDGRLFDIIAVHELGRRETLQIMASRRPDA